MLKHRIRKMEKESQINKKAIKLWDVKSGKKGAGQIADIKAGSAKHPDGSDFSANDAIIFLDFEMFTPKFGEGKCSNKD